MRRLRQPDRLANSLLRSAIRQVSARPGPTTSLLAGSLLLALAPSAPALTLGDISVRSALGQRLDATVPLRLGAGETLASACIVPGVQGTDLRHVPGARVKAPEAAREGQYDLAISSESALYEPMYELELQVRCPGVPVIVRQYVLMLDLPTAVAGTAATASVAAAVAPTARPAEPVARPVSAQPRATASRPAGTTITSGSRYRVSEGDTLSSIAARVRDRNVSLWTLADAIFAANPDAFIRNDANLIKLGSEIRIPESVSTAGGIAEAAPEPVVLTLPAPRLPKHRAPRQLPQRRRNRRWRQPNRLSPPPSVRW